MFVRFASCKTLDFFALLNTCNPTRRNFGLYTCLPTHIRSALRLYVVSRPFALSREAYHTNGGKSTRVVNIGFTTSMSYAHSLRRFAGEPKPHRAHGGKSTRAVNIGFTTNMSYAYLLRRFAGGVPGGTRTPDLLLRRQLLYPAELQAHMCYVRVFAAFAKLFVHMNFSVKRYSLRCFALMWFSRLFL